jgi:alkanesulfonate monooxygenase SsuD/methylene tetrahydromethanopterin reductase-like flavin-dependent oxidoreductase (luciferase family)
MAPSLFNDLLDLFFFPKVSFLGDELDFQTLLLCDHLGILSNQIAQRFGKLGRILKNPDLMCVQVFGHALRITKRLKITTDDHTIITM